MAGINASTFSTKGRIWIVNASIKKQQLWNHQKTRKRTFDLSIPLPSPSRLKTRYVKKHHLCSTHEDRRSRTKMRMRAAIMLFIQTFLQLSGFSLFLWKSIDVDDRLTSSSNPLLAAITIVSHPSVHKRKCQSSRFSTSFLRAISLISVQIVSVSVL